MELKKKLHRRDEGPMGGGWQVICMMMYLPYFPTVIRYRVGNFYTVFWVFVKDSRSIIINFVIMYSGHCFKLGECIIPKVKILSGEFTIIFASIIFCCYVWERKNINTVPNLKGTQRNYKYHWLKVSWVFFIFLLIKFFSN